VETLAKPISTGLSRARMLQLFERDRLGFLLDVARRYGPVVEIAPGTILVADPPAVDDAYRRTNTAFLLAQNLVREETGTGPGGEYFDEWMTGRRAVAAAMKPEPLTAHTRWLADEAERLVAKWLQEREPRNAMSDLEDLCARSFARFCFGDDNIGRIPRLMKQLLDSLIPVVSSPFQPGRRLRRLLPRFRRVAAARRELGEALESTRPSRASGGLVELLRDAGLPSDAVARMLVSTGIAAHRVPAAAIAWVLTDLAQHPGFAEDVADDASRAQPAEPPRSVRWAVNEALRRWPPTWVTDRTTETEQACGSWLLPANAAVTISPYVVHRTAACFERPDEFVPARWADLRPPRGAYIPFGSGSRSCVGASFGIAEVCTAITVLMRRLRFSLPSGPPHPDVRATLVPQRLTLSVEPR
jgi:cytochrome P450